MNSKHISPEQFPPLVHAFEAGTSESDYPNEHAHIQACEACRQSLQRLSRQRERQQHDPEMDEMTSSALGLIENWLVEED